MRDLINLNQPSLYRWPPLPRQPARTMRQIAQEIAQRHGLTLEDLKGPNRTKRISRVRFAAMKAVREQTSHSLPRIGQFFGGRDHTSVMHGIRRASGATVAEARASRALAEQEAA